MFIWCTFWFIFYITSPVHGNKDPHNVLEHVMHKREAVKTFEIDHHVIDCIDIYKQPALQHPLLVNHTIQLTPNNPSKTNNYVMEAHHLWYLPKSCPEGSIPIERVQPNDYFRGNRSQSINWYKASRYIRRQGQTNGQLVHPDSLKHEYAIFRSSGTFYGARATLNVWNPKLENRDVDGLSVAQIWVVSNVTEVTILEAGWLVYPGVNGDDQTRFFIYWTANGYKTSCYNLECPGFVQTNKRSIINPYMRPISVFGGQQSTIDLEIFKDRTNGNWWLRLQGIDMGYWPKEVVPHLAGGANIVDFGGEIAYTKRPGGVHTSTEMGSGHFANEGFTKSSFFRNLQLLHTDYAYQHPPEGEQTFADDDRCYDIHVGGKKDGPWGCFFFFGGPGRSDKCL